MRRIWFARGIAYLGLLAMLCAVLPTAGMFAAGSVTLTVGGQQLVFQGVSYSGAVTAGSGGAPGFDFEAGKETNTSPFGIIGSQVSTDLTFTQDANGNPAVTGAVVAVTPAESVPGTLPNNSVALVPGQLLLVLDHAGNFVLVQILTASPSGTTFVYDFGSAAAPPAPAATVVLTVGAEQLAFQGSPSVGVIAGGGYMPGFNLETGQQQSQSPFAVIEPGSSSLDLRLTTDANGNPAVSGVLLAVTPGANLPGPPSQATATLTAGESLLVLDHAGNYFLVQVQSASANAFAFTYLKGTVTSVQPSVLQPSNSPPGNTTIQLVIGSQTAVVDGEPQALDVPPLIIGGRTMVPLRFLGNALGAQVGWDEVTRTVTFTLGSLRVVLRIGQAQALVNGLPVALDVPATIVGGRTLVPVRFVSEHFGASVSWDAQAQTVTVSYNGSGPTPTPAPTPSPVPVPAPGGASTIVFGSETAQGITFYNVDRSGAIIDQETMKPVTVETLDPTSGAVGQMANVVEDYQPMISPDGSKMAKWAGFTIDVVSPSGGKLASYPNAGLNSQPVWSADGRFLAWEGAGRSDPGPFAFVWNDGTLWVADTTTGQLTEVTGKINGSTAVQAVRWLPQGGLVFLGADGKFHLVAANLRDVSLLPLDRGDTRGRDAFAISPDGSLLAWAKADANGILQIFSCHLDGTGCAQLTANGFDSYSPLFSPDGTKIAFVAKHGNWPLEIWTVNPDGTGVAPLKTPDGHTVDWVWDLRQWLPVGLPSQWLSR